MSVGCAENSVGEPRRSASSEAHYRSSLNRIVMNCCTYSGILIALTKFETANCTGLRAIPYCCGPQFRGIKNSAQQENVLDVATDGLFGQQRQEHFSRLREDTVWNFQRRKAYYRSFQREYISRRTYKKAISFAV